MWISVCHDTDLADPGSRGFEAEGRSFFVVQQNGKLFAYHNHCPHLGVNLEWLPDRFITLDGQLIQCAMHGALFRLESGLCIHGPCLNQSLHALPCERREDGSIWVNLSD